ncbi:Putative lipid phosphate phosphatase 3, chloroplastic [Triticum urartu]|uniref:Putative lipid phosphate phosphatase 3, chloroplastic n=1 Tax=Triticum urartu TaxID=4572 RepID=M7Z3R4_TRIUA|nr:Putative lipid phosphate phosphatase 3, chloroplastic [Triticum urartu]
MADIQLSCYTIKSHGAKIARLHMYDWIILVLLAVIDGLLNIIEPFHRFVGKDMMTDLRYPLQGNTVPFWAVPVIGIVLPFAIFGGIYFKKKNFYDLHHGILVITDAIKDGVGRPRPDFFWRCFPDGKDKSVIKEGHKSFPSGHSSWSFAGLGFLTWYLTGKIAVFDRKGHIAKLCIIVLPLLTAALVAVSRVDDYWHHWQDVFAGAIIGLTVSSFCYLQFFPYPFDADGLWPYAYNTLQLAEAGIAANSFSVQPTEETVEEGQGEGGIALRDAVRPTEEMGFSKYYSLRSELLVSNMDVSRTKIHLDTSISATKIATKFIDQRRTRTKNKCPGGQAPAKQKEVQKKKRNTKQKEKIAICSIMIRFLGPFYSQLFLFHTVEHKSLKISRKRYQIS